jgi:ABC-2 type transport system permease protein
VRTVRFLLEKEFRQIFRDRTMLRMLLVVPVVQLLVLSSAATFEVRDGRVHVVDQDRSAASRGLVDRIVATRRFTVAGTSGSMAGADRALLEREAAVVLRIPADFERSLVRRGEASLQLAYDAQDGAAAGILHSYLTRILEDYARELGAGGGVVARAAGARAGLRGATGTGGVEAGGGSTVGVGAEAGPAGEGLGAGPGPPPVEVRHQGWFNPELVYTDHMVPGILVLLVTIVSLAIMSMNIVREKELGTLEQINVTPVTRGQFVAGKLLPFWLIALVDLLLGLVVAKLVFDIPLRGTLAVILVGALVYLFVTLGIGLWISTVVETQQQAMFVSFTVNMVFLLMSGLFTPVASMPGWARVLAELSPVKHFIEVMRTVLVKGAGFAETALPLVILLVYGAVVFTLAVRQHSKTTA